MCRKFENLGPSIYIRSQFVWQPSVTYVVARGSFLIDDLYRDPSYCSRFCHVFPLSAAITPSVFKSNDKTFQPVFNGNQMYEDDELFEIPPREISWSCQTIDQSIIGNGSFGVIYRVNYKREVVALKKLQMSHRSNSIAFLEALKREAMMINRFRHANIVKIYGVCLEEPFLGILLEYCAGSSFKGVLQKLIDFPVSELTMLDWALQIANAMAYLAQRNCVHRDLKAHNVLVKQEACLCGLEDNVNNPTQSSEMTELCYLCWKCPLSKLTLQLSDFGDTKEIKPYVNRKRVNTVGTNAFLAPEAYRDHLYTEYSDVWSYGVLLWEIRTRKQPYGGVANHMVAFMVEQRGSTLELDESCPSLWKAVMQSCWKMSPSDRPTFEKICNTFQEYAENLSSASFANTDTTRQSNSRRITNSFSTSHQKIPKASKSVESPASEDKATVSKVPSASLRHEVSSNTSRSYVRNQRSSNTFTNSHMTKPRSTFSPDVSGSLSSVDRTKSSSKSDDSSTDELSAFSLSRVAAHVNTKSINDRYISPLTSPNFSSPKLEAAQFDLKLENHNISRTLINKQYLTNSS